MRELSDRAAALQQEIDAAQFVFDVLGVVSDASARASAAVRVACAEGPGRTPPSALSPPVSVTPLHSPPATTTIAVTASRSGATLSPATVNQSPPLAPLRTPSPTLTPSPVADASGRGQTGPSSLRSGAEHRSVFLPFHQPLAAAVREGCLPQLFRVRVAVGSEPNVASITLTRPALDAGRTATPADPPGSAAASAASPLMSSPPIPITPLPNPAEVSWLSTSGPVLTAMRASPDQESPPGPSDAPPPPPPPPHSATATTQRPVAALKAGASGTKVPARLVVTRVEAVFPPPYPDESCTWRLLPPAVEDSAVLRPEVMEELSVWLDSLPQLYRREQRPPHLNRNAQSDVLLQADRAYQRRTHTVYGMPSVEPGRWCGRASAAAAAAAPGAPPHLAESMPTVTAHPPLLLASAGTGHLLSARNSPFLEQLVLLVRWWSALEIDADSVHCLPHAPAAATVGHHRAPGPPASTTTAALSGEPFGPVGDWGSYEGGAGRSGARVTRYERPTEGPASRVRCSGGPAPDLDRAPLREGQRVYSGSRNQYSAPSVGGDREDETDVASGWGLRSAGHCTGSTAVAVTTRLPPPRRSFGALILPTGRVVAWSSSSVASAADVQPQRRGGAAGVEGGERGADSRLSVAQQFLDMDPVVRDHYLLSASEFVRRRPLPTLVGIRACLGSVCGTRRAAYPRARGGTRRASCDDGYGVDRDREESSSNDEDGSVAGGNSRPHPRDRAGRATAVADAGGAAVPHHGMSLLVLCRDDDAAAALHANAKRVVHCSVRLVRKALTAAYAPRQRDPCPSVAHSNVAEQVAQYQHVAHNLELMRQVLQGVPSTHTEGYTRSVIIPTLYAVLDTLIRHRQTFWAGIVVCCTLLPSIMSDDPPYDVLPFFLPPPLDEVGAAAVGGYGDAGAVEAATSSDALARLRSSLAILGCVQYVMKMFTLCGASVRMREVEIVLAALKGTSRGATCPRTRSDVVTAPSTRTREVATASSTDHVDVSASDPEAENAVPASFKPRIWIECNDGHARPWSTTATASVVPLLAITECSVCGLSILAPTPTSLVPSPSSALAASLCGPLGDVRRASGRAATHMPRGSGLQPALHTLLPPSHPEGCLVVQCALCGHGGHFNHIQSWWRDPSVRSCPHGCDCRCVY